MSEVEWSTKSFDMWSDQERQYMCQDGKTMPVLYIAGFPMPISLSVHSTLEKYLLINDKTC